ncbi:MAG TPA: glycoside hydrolase family 28 protein [Prolixibacteraceae bacterium]|nr:glycoside hydrolase family 28 protein [Prolixibacteraceae bacterium]
MSVFQHRLSIKTYFFLLGISFILLTSTESFGQETPYAEAPFEIAPLDAPFEMPDLKRPEFPDNVFNIKDFGAKERDGDKVKCTGAIHRAIDTAEKAGGGKVLIPSGDWLTGPIHLKSNINLHLEDGAMVYFSEDKEDYLPVVRYRHEGVEAYNYSPLIYANELENIAITGKGVFDGQAKHWLEFGTSQPRSIATKMPLSRRKNFGKGAGTEGMRPNFMVFWKCEDILVEDVTVSNGPMWNVHLIYSERAIIRGITVKSVESHNGDGVILDSSKDILVEYVNLSTGDDAVVIKSGFNEEGLKINIPTENVVVRNYYAHDVVTGSGGVVFGSETSGGIRNVYVHDALFENCDRGIRFKTARGRGNVTENIYVRDIELINCTYEALNFNTFYTGAGVGPSPLVRNIDIRNIKIDGVPNAIVLVGLPEKWLENIHLENIEVRNTEEAIRIDRVKNLTMKNIQALSEKRAMIADDVYELTLENVELNDNDEGAPIQLKGEYTGVVIMPGYSDGVIDFGKDVSEDIILDEYPSADW